MKRSRSIKGCPEILHLIYTEAYSLGHPANCPFGTGEAGSLSPIQRVGGEGQFGCEAWEPEAVTFCQSNIGAFA